ncbi:MAG: hypothetical protein QGH54_16175, partial [SAR202 cluster bacterium]|nr:hypothetical protein [SAR202 cluster bacterium]
TCGARWYSFTPPHWYTFTPPLTSTIAKLTQVISERFVQSGLRRTLLTQARRLEHLARQRLEQVPEDA